MFDKDSSLSCWIVAAVASALAACGGAATTPCPAGWVASVRGQCGPSVLLCAADGGARAGACGDASGDAGPFRLLGDGGLGGAWREPGEPGGPPARDWSPELGVVAAADWVPRAGLPTCPGGWVRASDGTCDPVLRADCPAGSTPLPGAACTDTSASRCATSTVPGAPPESAGATVVYVRASADPAVADGTLARPFATIAGGLLAAGAGGWVLVADGTYSENLTVAQSVHLVGDCAAGVEVRASDATLPVITVRVPASLDVRDLSTRGGNVGLSVDVGASASVLRVVVRGATSAGVRAMGNGAVIDATDAWIADTVPGALGPGRGMDVGQGARVSALRSAITGSHEAGVEASTQGSVRLEDSVIADTQSAVDGLFGNGVWADSGAHVVAERCALLRNHDSAVGIRNRNTLVELTDVLLRDTGTTVTGDHGRGVELLGGAHATLTRVGSVAQRDCALCVAGAGSQLTLADSEVYGTLSRTGSSFGAGLWVLNGAMGTVTGTVFAENQDFGVGIQGAGTSVQLCDVLVRDTHVGQGGTIGIGVGLVEGASAEVSRLAVERTTGTGIIVKDAGTTGRFSDVAVRGTRRGREMLAFSFGAALGAHAELRRARFDDDQCAAIDVANPGTRLDAVGIVMNHAADPQGSDLCAYGTVYVDQSGEFHGEQIRIDGTVGSGITVSGTTATLTDVVVTGVVPRGAPPAVGIFAGLGAQVSVARATVTSVAGTGMTADGMGTVLSAADVYVADNSGAFGFGAQSSNAATLAAQRWIVERERVAGIVVDHATLQFDDSVVRDVLADLDGGLGHGIHVGVGSAFGGVRAAIEHSREVGLYVDEGCTVDVRDVLVLDTQSSDRGFGIGVGVYGGATLTGERVAVRGAGGVGIAAAVGRPPFELTGTAVTLRAVFVQSVSARSIEYGSALPLAPAGPPVAYGLHAGRGCTLTASSAVIDTGTLGLFASDGTIRVTDGLIAGQLEGAGASRGQGTVVLQRVEFAGNARNDVRRDDRLPSAASLPPPASICPPTGCI